MNDKPDGTPLIDLLRRELRSYFSDWSEDFTVTVEHGDQGEEGRFFQVGIKHARLGKEFFFFARPASVPGWFEMDFTEDGWTSLDMGNVFAFMWFEQASRERDK